MINANRNYRYKKKLQHAPKYVKILIRKILPATVIAVIFSFFMTTLINREYNKCVMNAFTYTEEILYSKLENYPYSEKKEEFLYNVAGECAYMVSVSNSLNESSDNTIIKILETIQRRICGQNSPSYNEVQIYDSNGNFKCSTKDSIFALVKYSDETNKIYVCNNADEKYKKEILLKEMNGINGTILIKDSEFEPYIEGISDENSLVNEGYRNLGLNEYGVHYFMNYNINFTERDKTVTKIVETPLRTIEISGVAINVKIITSYNMWYDYGKSLIIMYIIIFLFVLIFTILASCFTYMSEKLQYENDQYRRNITNAMAHDLKSPLMAISGYVQNLAEKTNPEKEEHYLESIQNTVEYMDKIIVDILELSKSETKLSDVDSTDLATLDMKNIIEKGVEQYRLSMEKSNLKINILGNCKLEANQILITHAIDNLLGNAVKYAANGSEINIELTDKEMVIENIFNEEIKIESEKLVQPFVKGDNARKRCTGSGLGLSISKNLFKQYGYKMSIEIEKNKFIVRVKV